MQKIYNHNELSGGLDNDNLSQNVGSNDYRYALNIRNGVAYIKKKGGATLAKGNTLIPLTFFPYGTPTGRSKSIGSYEDLEFNTIIFMVWNENRIDSIFRYFPDKISPGNPHGEIHQIAAGNFGWLPNVQITSINTISGKSGTLLYWCDNVQGRRLNITKSNIVGKFKTWNNYLPKSITTFQTKVVLEIFAAQTVNPIYNQIIDTTGQPQITTIGEFFVFVASAINADSISNKYLLAEACDCSLTLTEKKANTVDILFGAAIGVPLAPIKSVPSNWYGSIITERFIDEAVYPSYLSPLVSFGINSAKQFNNVKNQVWQFRTGYLTNNFEEAVLSPWTQVPVNELVNDGLQIQNYNYLHIDFNDATLIDNLVLIQHMEVTARSGNKGVEQQVAQLDICDFIDYNFVTDEWICTYDFYNDTIANSIDPIRAQQQESGVPINNLAQDIVQNRLLKGGVTNGLDPIDCVDMTITQEFQPGDSDFFTITGRILIYHLPSHNDLQFGLFTPTQGFLQKGVIYKYPPTDPTNPSISEKLPQWGGIPPAYAQPDARLPAKDAHLDQFAPLGGFVVYVAGQDTWDITKQVFTQGTDSNDTQISTLSFDTTYANVLSAGNLQTIATFFNNADAGGNYVTHEFRLKVRPGKYKIRVASHWCSFGDVLGKGPMYDMNNGREYQTTSTYVYCTNKFNSATGQYEQDDFNTKEIEVEVINSDVNAGQFNIEDCRSFYPFYDGEGLNVENTLNCSTSGYLVDASVTGVNPNTIKAAPRMEGQGLYITGYSTPVPVFAYGSAPPPTTTPSTTEISFYTGYPTCSVTDHNGFFYTSWNWLFSQHAEEFPFKQQFIWQVVNNLTNIVQGGPNATGMNSIGYYSNLYDSQLTPPYVGASILNDLVSGTLALGQISIDTYGGAHGAVQNVYPLNAGISNDSAVQLLLFVSNPAIISDESTYIDGQAQDSNGNPITGAIEVYGKTGRFPATDINGNFEMLVYARADSFISNTGREQQAALPSSPMIAAQDLICYFNGTSANINNNPQSVAILDFTTYNVNNHFVLTSPFALVQNYQPYGKGLKRGGTYQLAIRYKDSAGRLTTVITNQNCIFYIPFITEDLNGYFPSQYPIAGTYLYGKPIITIGLNFSPPQEAVSYDLMLTLNQYETSYLQWVANQVIYVSSIGYSVAEVNVAGTTTTTSQTTGGVTTSTAVTTPSEVYTPPVISSYQAGDASNIYISMTNLVNYKNVNPSSILSYTFQAGDRLRLIADQNGIKYNQLFETEVIGYDTEQNAIIISNRVGFPQLFTGFLFEVLHVRLKTDLDEQVFYEVGESFLCTAPNTPNNAHSENPIVLSCGDTYWKRRQFLVSDPTDVIFSTSNYLVEDPNLSDFFVSNSWDIGRTGINDPFNVQTTEPTEIIVSDTYQTNSNSNGFCNFQGLNSKILDKNYGAIQRMLMIGSVLHVICENKSVSDYIGQRILVESKSIDGPVAIANDFLGTERAQTKDYGTQHPASVGYKDGYVYGLDANRFIVWRDADNGMTDISKATVAGKDGKATTTMQSYFKDLCKDQFFSVVCGIDKYYNEYILTTQKLIIQSTTILRLNINVLGSSYVVDASPEQIAQIQATTFGFMQIRVFSRYTLSWIQEYTTYTVVDGLLEIPYSSQLEVFAGDAIFLYYGGETDTIAFNEDENRWKTHYSFVPECYGKLGDSLYAFENGRLWIHDTNDLRANFFGVQYGGTITPVFNEAPDWIKIWQSIGMETLQADGKFNWSANLSNDYGQTSVLVPQNFKLKTRQWFSAIKRDGSDTTVTNPIARGKVLFSEALTVQLNTNYVGEMYIRALLVLADPAMRTGK